MRTLYVSDLDGTLLNPNAELSQKTRDTINTLIRQGMIFSYATARSYSSAAVVTKGLLTELPVILYNGTAIADGRTGKLLDFLSFEEEEIHFIKSCMKDYGATPLVYALKNGVEKVRWIPARENENIRHYLTKHRGDKRLEPAESENALFQGNIFYFTLIGEAEDLLPVYEKLNEDGRVQSVFQKEIYREEYWLEIMPREATKGKALFKLKKILKCEKAIVFGDGKNDLSMFQEAEEAYAVGNAEEELKRAATAVIGENREDAVAEWLNTHRALQ